VSGPRNGITIPLIWGIMAQQRLPKKENGAKSEHHSCSPTKKVFFFVGGKKNGQPKQTRVVNKGKTQFLSKTQKGRKNIGGGITLVLEPMDCREVEHVETLEMVALRQKRRSFILIPWVTEGGTSRPGSGLAGRVSGCLKIQKKKKGKRGALGEGHRRHAANGERFPDRMDRGGGS